MGLSKLDKEIAEHYAPKLLEPIKYGENAVFFWFPTSGTATILNDIFSSNQILKSNLSNLADRTIIYQFWGHLSIKRTFSSLLESSNFSSYKHLESTCLEETKKGNEVACVLGHIDKFASKERLNVLKSLLRLSKQNSRRIHILFMSTDKPWFERILNTHSELISLANRVSTIPVLSGDLLDKYIDEKSEFYNHNLDDKQKNNIVTTYGGILHLTKEYLRSNGNKSNLDLKAKVVWENLPSEYQKYIEMKNMPKSKRLNIQVESDFEEFGVSRLAIFSKYISTFNTSPERVLPFLLTTEEKNLWRYINSHRQTLISKDSVISLLRPNMKENLSLWAIDQAVSRFRKKLARAGIDPEQLRTVKGKGYIWEG